MRKLMAILIMAVFLVSLLPAAIAAKGEGAPAVIKANGNQQENRVEKALGNTEGFLQQQKLRVEERLQNIRQLKPEIADKLQQFRTDRIQKLSTLKNDKDFSKFKSELKFKARLVDKFKLEKAKENFQIAKDKFANAKMKIESAQLKLKQSSTIQACKNSLESEECIKAKGELRGVAKDKLLNHADAYMGILEQIKTRAEQNDALTEEESLKIISFADEKIAELESIKEEISSAETKEEILDAAKKLKAAWDGIKFRAKAYVGHLLNSRMAGIIVSADHLEAKLERVLERMAANGKDTSTVEPLVSDFNDKIALAKEKFKASQSAFLEIIESVEITAEEKSAKIQEAQDFLREAKTAIQDANAILRQIVQQLNALGATEELAEATELESLETEAELQQTEEIA